MIEKGKNFLTEEWSLDNIDLEDRSKVDVIVGHVGGGKTYTGMNDIFTKSDNAWFLEPTRALADELFCKYGKDLKCGLSTGEVKAHYLDPLLNRYIGIYESLDLKKVPGLDLIIIDEIHFITEFEYAENKSTGIEYVKSSRGRKISDLIWCALKNDVKVVGMTATPTLDFNEFGFNTHNLPPYKKIYREFKECGRSYIHSYISSKKDKIVSKTYENFPTKKDLRHKKFLIFVNSIDESFALPKKLRKETGRNILPYNASQNPRERMESQQKFINGEAHGLVTTDIAASGLNLPAELVYIPQKNYMGEEHPEYHFQQMLGRAGRPSYSTEAIIYASRLPQKIELSKSLAPKIKDSYPQISTDIENISKTVKYEIKDMNSVFKENFKDTMGSEVYTLSDLIASSIEYGDKYEPTYTKIKYELNSLKSIEKYGGKGISKASKKLLSFYHDNYNPADKVKEISGIKNDPMWKWDNNK